MDLTQSKLSKQEWDNIEIPVASSEKEILKLIQTGFKNTNTFSNKHTSLFSFTKIEKTDSTELMLYQKYFEEHLKKSIKKYAKTITSVTPYQSAIQGTLKSLKSADMIRIQNLDTSITENKQFIFEYLLLDLFHDLLKGIHKNNEHYANSLYTIIQLRKTSIHDINIHVLKTIEPYLDYATKKITAVDMMKNAYTYIEQNPYLLQYEDITLYNHQKEIFELFKKQTTTPKLVLYTAPTGTGKTLTPIGLSEGYRIIFVCVARHIGLALAKSCISVEKKVAFAFGCDSETDIRLHYFSAVEYTKHYKSGGIGKVDNSIGTNVEVMICDVHSYLTAMKYMLKFNQKETIITYWDEPTITMDYEHHDLHSTIQNNWVYNEIPKMVLSSATLPEHEEMDTTFTDYKHRFNGATIHYIESYDCRKSIPILDKNGKPVLPHYMYESYDELQSCVSYCQKNKTLLRYFHLPDIIKFLTTINDYDVLQEELDIDEYFQDYMKDITMNSIKEYYLKVLISLPQENWCSIYKYFQQLHKGRFPAPLTRQSSVNSVFQPSSTELQRSQSIAVPTSTHSSLTSSGVLATTTDAHTLTDGPTLYLCEDVKRIGSFYIKQSDIPSKIFQGILSKIMKNDELAKKIDSLERIIEAKESNTSKDENNDSKKKDNNTDKLSNESKLLHREIQELRKQIKTVTLDPVYSPNTRQHQQLWNPTQQINEKSFVSHIDEPITCEIMALPIDNYLKVLLLLGIGLFLESNHVQYKELMKKLAYNQQLYMIIASSDYIYGTNYQFCHGFIGKDLTNMTQQKTLQAMGRIGRNNIQQDYTIRFRDDSILQSLFEKQENDLETKNIRKLFGSSI